MEFKHVPVLLEECMQGLNLKDNGIYVDCTLGGAGHSFHILSRTNGSKLVGIDRDAEALAASKKRLSEFGDRVTYVHDNFKNLVQILKDNKIEKVDGILVDLGVSSYQLDNSERGFSYRADAKLDMRMDKSQKLSAYEVVNTYSAEKLRQIIKDYGEEKFATSIANKIDKVRKAKPIETTQELKEIILSSVPRYRGNDGSSNVQRTFQAIRIEVNGELDELGQFLVDATHSLKKGGRLAVISFHSLEDRIVKHTFRDLSTDCICPPNLPICVCGHRAEAKLIGKMITAGENELKQNSRSSSAKLRVIEKL
ncbi:MAG: 16S rRNA (cytosine(1402)-N(4))-methyltransferase RsmH [Clostridia bacterium]|nr:16S rRNA (cytosine(1402)-N(4))-methyltransferase RsmH [Clostridia bacterium]